MRAPLVLAALVLAACPSTPPLEYPAGTEAFVDVSVVSMADDSALEGARLLVRDGVIVDVLTSGDPEIDGSIPVIASGGYVMPGLVDLHVHTWFPGDLTLFVANGVTTVRNLFGDPLQLGWRAEIAAGERLGPQLVTAGPIIDGDPPFWPGSDLARTEAEARSVVQAQVDAGYDVVKVYSRLPADAWRGALDEAEALGVQAVGHVPASVDFAEVAGSTQVTIEHLDGLLEELAGVSWWDPLSPAQMTAALDGVDLDELADLAATLRDADTWNVPTLVVLNTIKLSADDLAAQRDRPELAYVHPQILASWQGTTASSSSEMEAWGALMDAWRGWTRDLHSAGAGIGLGTDCGNAYVIPGWSIHEELAQLVAAGLTPYEALRAGTADAATVLGRSDLGTVELGKRADLLWLDANPLDDVAHAARPQGVLLNGRWWTRDALDTELDEVAADYAR